MSGAESVVEPQKPGGRYRIGKLLAVFALAPVVLTVLLPILFNAIYNLVALIGVYDLLFWFSQVDRFFAVGSKVCMAVSWLAGPLAYAVNGGVYRRRHSAVRYAIFGGSIGAIVSIIVLAFSSLHPMAIAFSAVAIGQGVLYAIWLWVCLLLCRLFGPRNEVANANR